MYAFYFNLCPGPLWSGTLYFILHAFLLIDLAWSEITAEKKGRYTNPIMVVPIGALIQLAGQYLHGLSRPCSNCPQMFCYRDPTPPVESLERRLAEWNLTIVIE